MLLHGGISLGIEVMGNVGIIQEAVGAVSEEATHNCQIFATSLQTGVCKNS